MEKFRTEVAEKESLATFFELIYGGMKRVSVGYNYERCFTLRDFTIYSEEARKELIQGMIAQEPAILDQFVRESTTEAYLLDKSGEPRTYVHSEIWIYWMAPERVQLGHEFARWIEWGYKSPFCQKIVAKCPKNY